MDFAEEEALKCDIGRRTRDRICCGGDEVEGILPVFKE